MEGAGLAAKNRFDLAIATAWHTATFALVGYGGKLKGLSTYLSAEPNQRSNHADAIAFFHGLKAKGVPIEITRTPRSN